MASGNDDYGIEATATQKIFRVAVAAAAAVGITFVVDVSRAFATFLSFFTEPSMGIQAFNRRKDAILW